MVAIHGGKCKCRFVNWLQEYTTVLPVPVVMARAVLGIGVCPGTYYSLKEIS
jgi:hypothetical protein